MNYRRFFFPLSICYLAGYIKEKHNVVVYDADFNKNAKIMDRKEQINSYNKYLEGLKDTEHHVWDEFRTILKKFRPEVLGITAISSKLHSAYKIAEIAKEFDDNTKVVLGGPHVTALPLQAIKHTFVDFVIVGEGEITLSLLLDALEKGSESELHRINGLVFKKNGSIVKNNDQSYICDLDSLPYDFRELLINYKEYSPRDMGLMVGCRGCPFNCYFCASKLMWRRRVRFRSIENIIQEMKHVVEKFGTKHFLFEDDNFIMDRKRLIAFCKALKDEKLDITWEIQGRVGSLDEEICKILKASGCVDIAIGIESGSERILKDINKGTTISQARDTAKILNKSGLPWKAFIVVGFPTETENDIDETIKFIEEISPTFTSLHIFTPFPGTEFFNLYDFNEDDFIFFGPQSPHNHFCKNISYDNFQKIVSSSIDRINELNERNKKYFIKSNVWGIQRE
jgi:radical SAM superfamily enzyme YgiQ (UPF0313 family)